MAQPFHDLLIGLGATAFFAFLPSAVPVSRKIAIPGVLFSLFLTLWIAWPDVVSLLQRIRGTGNEDVPLWFPYLLGFILSLVITGFGGLIIASIKAHYTYLQLQIKFLNSDPDKHRFSCNIVGYDYLRNKENEKTRTCTLTIAFKHPISSEKLKIRFEGNKKVDYTIKKTNDRFYVVEFEGEVPIGFFIVTVS
jgi:hypothetical protein